MDTDSVVTLKGESHGIWTHCPFVWTGVRQSFRNPHIRNPAVRQIKRKQFYYGHKQNRFWKVLATLLKEPVPDTIEEKKQCFLPTGLPCGMWSKAVTSKAQVTAVLKCTADGYWHDSGKTNITRIYANGNKAGQLYKRYQFPVTGIEAMVLPSTSPANAAWSLERLCEAWHVILEQW